MEPVKFATPLHCLMFPSAVSLFDRNTDRTQFARLFAALIALGLDGLADRISIIDEFYPCNGMATGIVLLGICNTGRIDFHQAVWAPPIAFSTHVFSPFAARSRIAEAPQWNQ